ncbi:MAG: ATP synthase F0 subunit C [Chloroflexi bacterium]|nr:ATP synthase F0 subunit C [Chloroflexota bacterium]
MNGVIDAETMKMVAIGLAVSVGLGVPAFALSLIGKAAINGIARNPEAKGPISSNMILACAFTEAIGVYALIIAIILALVV